MGTSVACFKKKQSRSEVVPEQPQDLTKEMQNENPQPNGQFSEQKSNTKNTFSSNRPRSPNQIPLNRTKQDRTNSISSNTTNLDNNLNPEPFLRHQLGQPIVNEKPEGTENQDEHLNQLQSIKEEPQGSQSGSLISNTFKQSSVKQINKIYNNQQESLSQVNQIVHTQGSQANLDQKHLNIQKEQQQIEENDSDDSDQSYDSDDDERSEYEDEFAIDYIKGDLIQEGTRVYSALNVLNGQLLAVKMYDLQEDDDEELVYDTLERLLQLEHENIHKIIGYDQKDGANSLTIVMPFESGGSIRWLLQKFNKFSPHLAAIFMKQILEGLNYLHQQGLCHQNLKTSNVLVDEDANAKLSDVNIFVNKYEVSLYSAPECFENGEYTIYADVWSAGCIFIEMITQKNPWQQYGENISFEDIRNFLKSGRIFPLSSIDLPDILQLLKIIFKQNPEERLTPAQLLDLEFFKNKSSSIKKFDFILAFETNEVYKQSIFSQQSQILPNVDTNKVNDSQKLQQKPKVGHHLTKPLNPITENSLSQNKSNTQGSLTSMQKANIKKTHVLNQHHSAQFQDKKSTILKKVMDRMQSVQIDLSSSMNVQASQNEYHENENTSLTYNDLKMVITKKTITKYNDIIEEEVEDKTNIPTPRVPQNPLVNMGLIKRMTSVTSSTDQMQDKDPIQNQKSLKYPKQGTSILSKKLENQFYQNSSQSSQGSQMISANYKQSNIRSQQSENQSQSNSNLQLSGSTNKHPSLKKKVHKEHRSENLSKTQVKGSDKTNLVEQLIGKDAFITHRQGQEQDDVAKLEALMNQQFYQSGHLKNESDSKVFHQADQSQLEALIGKQFYNDQSNDYARSKEVVQDDQRFKIENLIGAQFYESSNNLQESRRSQEKPQENEVDKLEQLIGVQFYKSEVLVSRIKEEDIEVQDPISKMEELMNKQFYGSVNKDSIANSYEIASQKNDQTVVEDPIARMEALMSQQYFTSQIHDSNKSDPLKSDEQKIQQTKKISNEDLIANLEEQMNQQYFTSQEMSNNSSKDFKTTQNGIIKSQSSEIIDPITKMEELMNKQYFASQDLDKSCSPSKQQQQLIQMMEDNKIIDTVIKEEPLDQSKTNTLQIEIQRLEELMSYQFFQQLSDREISQKDSQKHEKDNTKGENKLSKQGRQIQLKEDTIDSQNNNIKQKKGNHTNETFMDQDEQSKIHSEQLNLPSNVSPIQKYGMFNIVKEDPNQTIKIIDKESHRKDSQNIPVNERIIQFDQFITLNIDDSPDTKQPQFFLQDYTFQIKNLEDLNGDFDQRRDDESINDVQFEPLDFKI